MSCLRDLHLISYTQREIAYHACISVAFIVETIRIARRVAAQPARRTHTPAGGGEVLMGPHEVPGGSWIARCRDPQGAQFAMIGPRR